ncbi:hypothetical protein BR63_11175 [Thermanaerosceptrum fracticalcis]|uniref:Large polyvalent protein associated domain-containing protein n=1 Tax=Thermanaerosceptrum fracticalcis TaxID=1712410 RepID=A0A7G6E418_THEFR|nr:LPD38 domain-containing protein [Thermanaerosceptrum fracticalcis]QNB46822.1 hypothetical protein BR63_11175 [Thermanaerosceptrum fracticalcis]
MAQKNKSRIITGKTGDEIIAERKAKAQFGAGAYPTGDDIIAQRKAATMPKIEWQDIQRQEKELLGGSEDFARQLDQKIKDPEIQKPQISDIPSWAKMRAGMEPSFKPVDTSSFSPAVPAGTDNKPGFLSAIAKNIMQGFKTFQRGLSSAQGAELASGIDEALNFEKNHPILSRIFGIKAQQYDPEAVKKLTASRDSLVQQVLDLQEQSALERQALNEEYAHLPKWQQVTSELVGTVGQVAPIAAAHALSPLIGTQLLYGMAAGNAAGEALQSGADIQTARKAGMTSGIKEVAIERLFGGIPGMGKGVLSPEKLVEKYIKSPVGQAAVKRVANIFGEGTEEIVAELLEPFIKRYYYDPNAPMPTADELAMAFGGGAVVSALLGIPVDVLELSSVKKSNEERFHEGAQAGFGTYSGPVTVFDKSYTAKELKKQGYKELKKGIGIWVKTDPVTDAHIDTKREMVNINGLAVFKSDIYLTEKKIGRKLTPKELAMGAKDPNYFKQMRGRGGKNRDQDPNTVFAQAVEGAEQATGKVIPISRGKRLLPEPEIKAEVRPEIRAFEQSPEAGTKIIEQRKGLVKAGDTVKIDVPQSNEQVERVVVSSYAPERLTASAEDLAADYKAKGYSAQTAYGQFVKDRALKPEMDAKEFSKIFNSVSPKLLRGETVTTKASEFSMVLKETFSDKPKRVKVVKKDENSIQWIADNGMTGSTPKNYVEYLKPVDEVIESDIHVALDGELYDHKATKIERSAVGAWTNALDGARGLHAKTDLSELPLERVRTFMKEYGIDQQEQKKILEMTEKYLEGAKKAGLDVEHIVNFTNMFTDEITSELLKAHGLKEGSKAYIAGKAMIEKRGAAFRTSIELLANPNMPITQEIIHEYAELWTSMWQMSNMEDYEKAINFLVERGLDKDRAEEHLSEIIADYAMSRDDFQSEGKSYFAEMIKRFKEWVQKIIKRLTYFRKNVEKNLAENIKTQAEAFARGDWEKAFEGVKGKESAKKTSYSVKEYAPPFYSQLEKVIQEKMPNIAPVEMVRSIIEKNGVKADEMKWTGMDDLLAKGGKLTKQEVLNWIRSHQIEVEEIMSTEQEYRAYKAALDEANRVHSLFVQEALKSGMSQLDAYNLPNKLTDGRIKISEIPENLRNLAEDYLKAREAYESFVEIPLKPRYSSFQEPGGKDYRELLLVLPFDFGKDIDNMSLEQIARAGPVYQSSHWEEPNVLAHVRFNERIGPDGERILFLEEVQSDWHQTGRKKGYIGDGLPEGFSLRETEDYWVVDHILYGAEKIKVSKDIGPEAKKQAVERAWQMTGSVPEAPFSKNWHEFVLKRMLRYAAENGFDRIAWTTGEQQAERYNLSKQVSRIEYSKIENDDSYMLKAFDKLDHQIMHKVVEAAELENFVGKEIAAKIINGEGRKGEYKVVFNREKVGKTDKIFDVVGPGGEVVESYSMKKDALAHADALNSTQNGVLTDLDLKVGGEGMKGFYDKMIPDFLNRYGKKWGARVEEVWIEGGKQLSLPITPLMKEAVLYEGQPRFAVKDDDFDPILATYMRLFPAQGEPKTKKAPGDIGQEAEEAVEAAFLSKEEVLKKPPIKVVRLNGNEILDGEPAVMRAQARELLKPFFNKTYKNKDTGYEILITERRLKHGFSHGGKPQIVAALALPDLLREAVKVASVPPKNKHDGKMVHVFYGALQIGDELYNAKLIVKEYHDGKKYYDHLATNINIERSSILARPNDPEGSNGLRTLGDLSEISLTDLLSTIKGHDRKYLPDWFKDEQLSNKAKEISIPIDDRTIEDVGDRRIKAYMYEHPELKEFIQAEAVRLLTELTQSIKGKRFSTVNQYGERITTGTKRLTSKPLERIMQLTGASPGEVEEALKRIINDNGQENVALAKQIELVIDDNLSYGTTTLEGVEVLPNFEYLDAKREVAKKYEGKRDTEGLTSKLGQTGVGPATGKNTTGKAKRASEIVKDFEKKLEMAVKKGGIHWSRLGQFDNRTHITRIAKANDLATLSHEAGHYFDKLYTLSEITTIKKRLGAGAAKIDSDLLALGAVTSRPSYPKFKQRREGIAEFIRLYLTDRDKTEHAYPELSEYIKKYIPRDVMGVIEMIARDIYSLVNLDPVARGMKSVWFKGDPRYPAPVDLTRMLRQIYTGIVDATYPVEWAAGELGGRVFQEKIANELSTLRGWEGIALADINPKGEPGYYQSDLDGKKVGPSYFEITKPIHKDEQTRREFWVYSIARRSKDYLQRGLEMPDSPETYDEQIRILEAKHPEFKKIFDKTREYRSNAYDLLVQGGIYSKADKAKIELANPNYVSLKRIKEAFDYVAGTSQKLGAAKRVVKGLKGGGEDIMDPEENDINNTFIYRSVAMRNRLLLELADMADKAEGKGKIMSRAPVQLKAVQFNLEKVKKYLYDVFEGMEGIEEVYGDAKQFVDSLDLDTMARIFNPQYLAGPNQVVVYRDGEPVLYDVHPDLYEAIKGLTPENVNLVTKVLMNLAQVQKTGIIYTPQFIYRNAARDTFHNLVSSDTHLNPVDIFQGFWSALKGDKWYRLAARKGGTTNYFTANDREFAQEAINQIMSNGNRAHEFVLKLNEAWGLAKEGYVGQGLWAGFKAFGTPLRFLQDWIEPGEMAGRLAEMKKGMKKYLKAAGFSDADIKAMDEQKLLEILPQEEIARNVARMRNLSVDFRKMGSWVRRAQLNRLVNFLNPSIQGTVNVGRLLAKHPWRTIAKGLLYITIPTLFNLWLTRENENYRELPWWRRDFFWNIPLGDPKTTRWFFPVPRPWELGIMFGAIPERLLDKYLKDNPNAWKEFAQTINQALVPEIIPSAIEPFYRDATGRDWRGNPILSESDKRVSPELQYNEYTSILVRKISEGLADVPGIPEAFKSPKRLQRLIEGYTGTLGRVFLESIDMTFGGKPGIPVLGGLSQGFVADAYRQPQSVSDFYDYKKQVETQVADYRRLHEGQKLPGELAAVNNVFNAASQAIDVLEDALHFIEKSDRPNKTLEAAAVRSDMIDIVRAVNKFYEENFLRK